MAAFNVREARESDCVEILRLIKELAEFEKMVDQVKMDVETLKRDGFGQEKLYECLVAEVEGEEGLAGILLYHWPYSTWVGRSMYIEDIYISPRHRRKGIASAMWTRAIQIAQSKGYERLQWSVLGWNKPAISFYQKMGGMDMCKEEEWQLYRLDSQGMQQATQLLSQQGTHHS